MPKLHENYLTRIRDLENEIDPDICLLAIKRPHLFILEAKLAPNHWESIKEVYPETGFKAFYTDFESAKTAKSELKLFFKGQNKEFKKRPIRIRKIEPLNKIRPEQKP